MTRAKEEGVQVAVVSAKVESELNELPKEEAKVRNR
jgi:obg-like ATPase 1